MKKSVPVHYIGVWDRKILRRGQSPRDTTSRVYWLQTPLWHADVRIPATRPSFNGVRSLTECSEMQLQALLAQEAFCGITIVKDDLCYWHRMMDMRLRRTQDVGKMVFEGDAVEEIGVLTDYYELWHRMADTCPASEAYLSVPRASEAKRVLCIAGNRFIFMRDRRIWDPTALRIQGRIEDGTASRSEVEAFLDFEASFGRIVDGQGLIEMSTLPWREGEIAFEIDQVHAHFCVDTAQTPGRDAWLAAEYGMFPIHEQLFEAVSAISPTTSAVA